MGLPAIRTDRNGRAPDARRGFLAFCPGIVYTVINCQHNFNAPERRRKRFRKGIGSAEKKYSHDLGQIPAMTRFRRKDMEKKRHIPLPGQRIIRSAVAVALCLLVYILRGRQGIPFYSAIAALQCMQPYTKDMRGVARKRILGTVIGAAWGLLLLLLEIAAVRGGTPDESLHYVLIPLILILDLYSTVLLKVQEMAYFSGVVFLAITVNHFSDANPYLFAFNRLLDTVIGVVIASAVNRIHLPRRRNTDTLFVSALGHSLLGSDSRLSPYSLVELNRLMDDGAKFTLSTKETQATVRELLPGVRLRYPIITMDGAALYDMGSLEYIRTTPMSEEKAVKLVRWLRERNVPFFSNSIEQNLLVIRYAELPNEGMRQVFEQKRHSPYRNYIRSDADPCEHIVYLLAIDTGERIEAVYQELTDQPWIGEYRVVKGDAEQEGYSFLKIYDVSCSRETMLREMEKLMGTKETMTFGGTPGKYDVTIENADRNLLVRELKRRFEPVDLRCWRSIFH